MNSIESTLVAVLLISNVSIGYSQAKEEKKDDGFRWVRPSAFGQIGAGYVVVKKRGAGLATIDLQMGPQFRFYFPTKDRVLGGRRPRDLSLFFRLGCGPILVRTGIVPIYYTSNVGFTYSYRRTNVSYGIIIARNPKEGQEPQYIYGVSASLDQIQVPFFINLMKGESMHYLLVAGFRVPLTASFPRDSESQPRNKSAAGASLKAFVGVTIDCCQYSSPKKVT
jgi:hypothetical protein